MKFLTTTPASVPAFHSQAYAKHTQYVMSNAVAKKFTLLKNQSWVLTYMYCVHITQLFTLYEFISYYYAARISLIYIVISHFFTN